MTLSDALTALGVPGMTLADARATLSRFIQTDAYSDYAWAEMAAELRFWAAVVSVLEVAERVGHDNLPDVTLPARATPDETAWFATRLKEAVEDDQG